MLKESVRSELFLAETFLYQDQDVVNSKSTLDRFGFALKDKIRIVNGNIIRNSASLDINLSYCINKKDKTLTLNKKDNSGKNIIIDLKDKEINLYLFQNENKERTLTVIVAFIDDKPHLVKMVDFLDVYELTDNSKIMKQESIINIVGIANKQSKIDFLNIFIKDLIKRGCFEYAKEVEMLFIYDESWDVDDILDYVTGMVENEPWEIKSEVISSIQTLTGTTEYKNLIQHVDPDLLDKKIIDFKHDEDYNELGTDLLGAAFDFVTGEFLIVDDDEGEPIFKIKQLNMRLNCQKRNADYFDIEISDDKNLINVNANLKELMYNSNVNSIKVLSWSWKVKKEFEDNESVKLNAINSLLLNAQLQNELIED